MACTVRLQNGIAGGSYGGIGRESVVGKRHIDELNPTNPRNPLESVNLAMTIRSGNQVAIRWGAAVLKSQGARWVGSHHADGP